MTVDPRQYDYFPCLRRLTVYTFTRDIQCSIVPEHYLLILKCSNNGLQNIPLKTAEMAGKINRWAKIKIAPYWLLTQQ